MNGARRSEGSTAQALARESLRPHSRPPMQPSCPAQTLLIEGPDAIAFAHAQFSSPVTSLTVDHWQFSAWLDPQGRVRALFQLARIADDRLLLLLRGGQASVMADALRRFVFRSGVSLTAMPARTLSTGPAQPLHELRTDNDLFSFGCGTHALEISIAGPGDNNWRLPQIQMGWPWLPESQLNELLPPALSLQRLHAAAIDKGCYPGQEIVARLHYRGGSKRHLHTVELSQPAIAGESLRVDGREVGCLLDVVRHDDDDDEDRIDALAVLHDDVVSQASDGRLDVFDNGMNIRLCTAWAS